MELNSKDGFLQLRDAQGFIKLQTLSLSNIIFHKLLNPRLLDLSRTHISIALSKHLCCLDLSYTQVVELPKQIQHLHALQVLRLNCFKLHHLPEELNELTSLRCLEVFDLLSVGKDQGYKVLEPTNIKSPMNSLDNIRDKVQSQEATLSEKPQSVFILQWGNISEADWPKIVTKTPNQLLANHKDQSQGSVNKHQIPTVAKPAKESNVSQDQAQCSVNRHQIPIVAMLAKESNVSQSQGVEDGVPSSRSSPKLWLPWLTSQSHWLTVSEKSSRGSLLLRAWLVFASLLFVQLLTASLMDKLQGLHRKDEIKNPGSTPLVNWEFRIVKIDSYNIWLMAISGLLVMIASLVYIISLTVHFGWGSQARDTMKRMHVRCWACWHDIQMLRVKAPGLSHAKGILILFGESYECEKDKLIQLWIVGGSIKNEPMEENGANYFEKLVSEGYILRCDSNRLYKVNSEKLNSELEMVRDKSSFMRLESTSQSNVASAAETLHIAVVGDEINDMIFKTLRRLDKLKTLLFLGDFGPKLQQLPRDLFHESLVALDLSGTHIKELPSSAGRMIHLRYLDLSWTLIELLPEWIDRFQELQILKLKGCSGLRRLPNVMKRLVKLRHLDLDVLGQLATFPKGMGALINLRTLSAFVVGTVQGLKITELEKLNYLAGEFCIAKLEHVRSVNEAEKASLIAKTNIKKLELRWSDWECEELKNEDKFILESLRPHLDLEEIHIVCYRGPNLPSWIADESFKKLISITLFRCEHVSILPCLEKLPALEGLELISLKSVTKMDYRSKGSWDRVAFPRLLKLAVDEMLNLKSWTDAHEADYPCLVELSIKDCPELLELPSLAYLPSIKLLKLSGCANIAFESDKHLSSSLQELILEDCPLIEKKCSKEGGEDWHKIQHVPTIWIDQVAVQTYKDGSKVHIDDDES